MSKGSGRAKRSASKLGISLHVKSKAAGDIVFGGSLLTASGANRYGRIFGSAASTLSAPALVKPPGPNAKFAWTTFSL
jgi:hypothetical protein